MSPSFTFAEPAWLWFTVLAPLSLAVLFAWAARRRRQALLGFAPAERLLLGTASHQPARRHLKEALLLLATAAIGLAFARPQWGVAPDLEQVPGEDVVFLLDCSHSMSAADLKPSRLERAKFAILDFVERHGRGRVGLVTFAGQAFLQCPLTLDYDAFRDSLLAVQPGLIPVPGTDIGRALDEAEAACEKDSRRKLLVLLTDGEDLEQGGARRAAELAKSGVTVFAVGVGTPSGSPVLVADAAGSMVPLRDAANAAVVSALDETSLRAIAEATGGAYTPLGPAGEGIPQVLQLADAVTSVARPSSHRSGAEHFHVPLALALCLLALEPLLGTRRRSRPRLAPAPALAALLLCAVPTLHAAPPARLAYNAGVEFLAEEKWNEAELQFRSALEFQDPAIQPAALYNLGHVRFAQGAQALARGPQPADTATRADAVRASLAAQSARAWAALDQPDLEQLQRVYLEGRAALKESRRTLRTLTAAAQAHGRVLARWQRSAGDFRGAHELRPSDEEALRNAEIVDRYIRRLLDQIEPLQASLGMAAQERESLRAALARMRGKLPPAEGNGDGDEDDEGEDEDEDEQGRDPREAGPQPAPAKPGEQQGLTPEDAARILAGLQPGGTRTLPVTADRSEKPKERQGRNW